MPLELILDAPIPHLSEPGYWDFFSTRRLAEQGNPSDQASHQGIWCDEPTKTLMLRPLQLESSFLNTAAQVDSIISLNQMYVNSADTDTSRVFEAPAFGNNDNPYIFHRSVGPSGAFPSAAHGAFPGAFPGDGPSLVGIPSSLSPTIPLVTTTQGPTVVYQPSLLTVSNGPAAPITVPAITPIGAESDGKFICQGKTRLDANQAVFFRWFQPNPMLGFPCIYEFYVGQYKIRVKDVVAEIFRDDSAAGDRSSFKLVQRAPLWCVGDTSVPAVGLLTALGRPTERLLDHDRSLLWLPFRRNQVLLYSNEGKWAILQVNNNPKRLPDNSAWDITRSDTVIVWVMTPAAGRFQVQKVKYPSGTIKMQSPTAVIDYTPSTAPTVTITKDTDHGTTITSAQSQPPSYTLPTNDANDCPPATTTGAATDRRREYGIELSFTASSDRRWTPFFYGFTIEARRAFDTALTTPFVFGDHGPGLAFVGAEFSLGLSPGECHATCEAIDEPPAYALTPYYFRSNMVVQVYDTASNTVWFTGITKPPETTLVRNINTDTPIRVTYPAQDRWKQLADTYMRDQRDWTTFGHIDVVKFVCEQGGVDCTLAEFPAGYVPANSPETGTINTINSPLGGSLSTIAQQTKDLNQGWRPQARDTAATFIQRVAELYSGWYVGFRKNGRFFYLPKDYFTTPTVTFTDNPTDMSGNPRIYGQVTWTTQEPEANVIVVMAGNGVNGNIITSSTWIDWASIRNPQAKNYIGRWRAEVVEIGGNFLCPQINWIARTIWNQTRRRHRFVEFEADFVPSLEIGHAFTLASYLNYRLIGMNVKLDRFNLHKAHYKGELIETGY